MKVQKHKLLFVVVFVCVMVALACVMKPRPEEKVTPAFKYIGVKDNFSKSDAKGFLPHAKILRAYTANYFDLLQVSQELQTAALDWIGKYLENIKRLVPEYENDLFNWYPHENEKVNSFIKWLGENMRENYFVVIGGWKVEEDILVSCYLHHPIKLSHAPGSWAETVSLVLGVIMDSDTLELENILMGPCIWAPLE